MAALTGDSADLSSEPSQLAAMLSATRTAYQEALVETAQLRQELDSELVRARQSAEAESREFLPDAVVLDRVRYAWETFGRVDAVEPPPPQPTTLEAAVTMWNDAAARATAEIARHKAARDAWSAQRKPRFKKVEPEPLLNRSVLRDLETLKSVKRGYEGVRRAWVQDRSEAEARRLRSEFETRVAARDVVVRQMMTSQVAAINLIVEMLGRSGQPWERALGSADLGHVPTQTLRLGSIPSGLPPPDRFDVPCAINFPSDRALAIAATPPVRSDALELLRSVVLRVLLDLPPGGLELTLMDPTAIGQTFADFVHLGDHDERLIDTGVKTTQQAIERSLAEHVAHLETVISKYLRGQFTSIHEYNRHAGEMAEPFRLLAIADYPRQFSDRAAELLLSLVENGPRCGVYTVLLYSPEDAAPREMPFSRLLHGMDLVSWSGQAAEVRLAGAGNAIGFVPDRCPAITFDVEGQPTSPAARALELVGAAARRGASTVVTLESFLPAVSRNRSGVLPAFRPGAPRLSVDPQTWWTASTVDEAVAPIGRSGAQGVASIYFSSTAVAGGAIMVGLPRSGKTTSLHAMIMTMAMLYPPDELELFLIDAKHGVEFKVYEDLPHARMVSVHSEREFSVAVLKSLQATIRERAEVMKAHGSGSSNLTEYRRASGQSLPRVVAVIDEFHEIFEEPDSLGMEAFAAFSDIVRMGPFSGVHVVVASQTLSSMPAMDRQTLTLLPQRVAFMCNDYDAEIVMGDSNRAVRTLSKTGEGLFNPARGDESKNQSFQGLYVDPEQRRVVLRHLRDRAESDGWTRRPRVFDGDAVVTRRPQPGGQRPGSGRFVVAVGEPFALAEQESVVLSRAQGANVLLLGDRDDDDHPDRAVRGVVHSFLLAAQSQGASVTVVDFVGHDDGGHEIPVIDVARETGARYVRSRSFEQVMTEALHTVTARTGADDYRAPTELLVLSGLQRALSLSPLDPYADISGDAVPAVNLVADVLVGGPDVGVHVVVVADRMRSVEARLGNELLNEFAIRVAGSAADQKDLAAVSGSFGDVPPLRAGQLLVGDLTRGTNRRARGYEVLTERDIKE